MAKKPVVFKVGRDAGKGTFVTLEEAARRPKETVVETIKRKR